MSLMLNNPEQQNGYANIGTSASIILANPDLGELEEREATCQYDVIVTDEGNAGNQHTIYINPFN